MIALTIREDICCILSWHDCSFSIFGHIVPPSRVVTMKSRSRMLPMLAASLVVGVVSAEAKTCDEGDTRQEHPVGNFNFVTSSWVEKKGKLRRYVSCVKNLDPNSDLLVTWFIAGPFQTYVPATVELPTPRLRDDISPRPVRGCIQYAYRNTTSARIRFLSPEEQRALVAASNGAIRDLVSAALVTGARFGELARLRVADYDVVNKSVFIAESKGGKPRHVRLPDGGADLFARLAADRGAGKFLLRQESGAAWAPSTYNRSWKAVQLFCRRQGCSPSPCTSCGTPTPARWSGTGRR
ncbi:tyrosine-type recombinase/integrase [Mesorhizobium sp. M0808]|uniref:tyrosine-type recombinase/integrase n=1 Tax=Mesorhizobium sp. M0808 TaxID=2957002 RepID=UPI00333BBA70